MQRQANGPKTDDVNKPLNKPHNVSFSFVVVRWLGVFCTDSFTLTPQRMACSSKLSFSWICLSKTPQPSSFMWLGHFFTQTASRSDSTAKVPQSSQTTPSTQPRPSMEYSQVNHLNDWLVNTMEYMPTLTLGQPPKCRSIGQSPGSCLGIFDSIDTIDAGLWNNEQVASEV